MSLFCHVHWILTKKFRTLSSSGDCVVSSHWLRITHKWLWSCRCFPTETSWAGSETHVSSSNYQTTGLTLLGVFRTINGEYFLTFLDGKRITYPWSLYGKDLLPPTKMPMNTNKIHFQYFKGSWKPLCIHAPQDKNLCGGKALAEIQTSSSGAAINLEA